MSRSPVRRPETLSLSEARRIALTAQGFDRARPKGAVTVAQLRRTLRRLGLVQIDFVSVLIPAQYQVPFSRLGLYDIGRFADLVYRSRLRISRGRRMCRGSLAIGGAGRSRRRRSRRISRVGNWLSRIGVRIWRGCTISPSGCCRRSTVSAR